MRKRRPDLPKLKEPTPIEKALTSQAAKKAEQIGVMSVKVAAAPLQISASHQLAFTRGKEADPADATLLLFDPKIGAYRAVLTPPGTSWELVEKRQGPGIWTPGRPA